MVFYRKYRPQSLEDLAGQQAVINTLRSAVSAGKLAHAYLFCGPRGTGKTSTARILAKIVNCESSYVIPAKAGIQEDGSPIRSGMTDRIPCNKCQSCVSITNGSNMDVIEMDAASNRGIEDIRSLRENIKLAPTSSHKKVYIIDEVHMLSGDAFNALLKTLEEPPEHVLFILATTEVQKIPQTILSRTQRLDFKPGSSKDLKEVLEKIAKEEKIEIDEEALNLLVKKAGGSFRDGEKFLDQLSSLGKIDKRIVEENLGTADFFGVAGILENLAKKDCKGALVKLNEQFDLGTSPKELTLALLDVLSKLIYIKNDLGEQIIELDVGAEKYEQLHGLAKEFNLEDLVFALDCFQKSLEQSRYIPIVTLPLEMAVVGSCGEKVKSEKGKVISEEVEVQAVNEAEELRGVAGAGDPHRVPAALARTSDGGKARQDPELLEQNSSDILKIHERWAYILETVKAYNCSLEALLRSSKIISCDEKSVIIEVPYSFHQRILEAPKSRDLIQSILSDVLGRSIIVSTVLGARPNRKEDLANIEVAADDEIIRAAAEIFSSDPVEVN